MNPRFPILLLLAALLLAGLFTFGDYGLSWDEPLFYDYAESIQGAYQGWDKLDESVYGRSPADHKNRGPAYLLLAQPLVDGLLAIGLDLAAAWHLVNFVVFYLVGATFFYWLMLRWVSPLAAIFSTAFFVFQPLIWGHAFINPKDTIFMAFFIASVYLGLRWVDWLSRSSRPGNWLLLQKVFWPAIVFGFTISVRILAPLAGLIVLLYALLTLKKSFWARANLVSMFLFATLAFVAMLVTWPYLWANPLTRLYEVIALMSAHPASILVLFEAQLYPAYELPWTYLPKLLVITLTEPTWLLFALGLAGALWKKSEWKSLGLMFLWFLIPFLYVVLQRPPLSDNFRHFLFMLPPVFIFGGIGFDRILWAVSKIQLAVFGNQPLNLERLPLRHGFASQGRLFNIFLAGILLLPGIWGIVRLHPYQYTYYNSLPSKTYRVYENDYWLTCYKEAIEWVRENEPGQPLYIHREFRMAAYYGDGMDLRDLRYETPDTLTEPALLLFSTRANFDQRSEFRREPVIHVIGREGVEFCLLKAFTP
jgi:hypothetical protein